MIRRIWNFLLDYPLIGVVICILIVSFIEAHP